MKFKLSLIFFLFAGSQSILSVDFEIGNIITLGNRDWKIIQKNTKEPKQGKLAPSVSQSRTIITLERLGFPYLLTKEAHVNEERLQKIINTRKNPKLNSSYYKLTSLGAVTFSSLGLLAGYGLYYCFQQYTK